MDGRIEKKKKVNKWKVSFFVMALMFEIAREIAVVEANSTPQPNALGNVSIYGNGEYVSAQGVWRRVNPGSPLVRQPATIECRKELGICIESIVMILPGSVMAPDVSIHPAVFTNDAITWSDASATCVRYEVRIDLPSSKIVGERKKKMVTNQERSEIEGIDKTCGSAEPFIAMSFEKSNWETEDLTKEHFLPVLRLLKMIFSNEDGHKRGGS